MKKYYTASTRPVFYLHTEDSIITSWKILRTYQVLLYARFNESKSYNMIHLDQNLSIYLSPGPWLWLL